MILALNKRRHCLCSITYLLDAKIAFLKLYYELFVFVFFSIALMSVQWKWSKDLRMFAKCRVFASLVIRDRKRGVIIVWMRCNYACMGDQMAQKNRIPNLYIQYSKVSELVPRHALSLLSTPKLLRKLQNAISSLFFFK